MWLIRAIVILSLFFFLILMVHTIIEVRIVVQLILSVNLLDASGVLNALPWHEKLLHLFVLFLTDELASR